MSRAAAYVLVLALVTAKAACAAPAAAPVRAEIDALLTLLETSRCEFYRNGGWYTGAEARKHLAGKLEYLERSGTVSSTEQFIELAASKSSVSGQPYQVRCPGEAAVTSAAWLSSRLRRLRAP